MKKKYKIENLCCANCGAKIEAAINKLEGVNEASLNFVMQKLTIDAEDEKFDDIMVKVEEIAHRIEPEMSIVR